MNKDIKEIKSSRRVPFVPLGEVAEFKLGQPITSKNAIPGTIPIVGCGQHSSYYHNEYDRIGETTTVAGSAAYTGYVSYCDIPIYLSDAFSVKPEEFINKKYSYYYLKNIQEKIHSTKRGGGVPHVYGSFIAKFKILISIVEDQERVVLILNKFRTLLHDLQEGLSSEITLSRKQYEYYCDLLLNFDPL